MPTPVELRPLLRHEVGMLRRVESRRVFDSVVHLGRFTGPRERFVVRAMDRPTLDTALRADVLSELINSELIGYVASCPSYTGWLTRAGAPEPHDDDFAWLAAARMACGQHGHELAGFYAITRGGWLDVCTGEQQTWRRLRL